MSKKSQLIRIPNQDYFEIKNIAQELQITIPAAFNVWKNKSMLKIKWKAL